MKRTIPLAFLFLLFFLMAQAQTDQTEKAFEKEFQSFMDSIVSVHQQFLSENDSLFLEFLRSSWNSYKTIIPDKKEENKPVVQPRMQEDSASFELHSEKPAQLSTPAQQPANKDSFNIEKPEILLSRAVMKEINYYGVKASLYFFPDRIPSLDQVSNQGIASFFREMASNKEWDFNLTQLHQLKHEHNLNDWGYYCLLKKASTCFFEDQNEQILFTWYMLLKSNYDVRTGYSGNDILLLLPTLQQIYNVPFLNLKGKNYYLLNGHTENPKSVFTYDSSYPASNRIFSLLLDEYPLIDPIPVSKTLHYMEEDIRLQINISMIDFFSGIPLCSMQTYFRPLLKPDTWAPIDSFLVPRLSSKTDREKIDVLLDFIQTAIPYETDQQQFGKERYLFAEECLFYPYADCEDRTILMAQMVKHYTKLNSIALEFPGHVVLAVDFGENEKGTFINYLGKKYIICDPTYIHARSGMLPDELKNTKAMVIDWDGISDLPKITDAHQPVKE